MEAAETMSPTLTFIQAEHQEILTALHKEIERLQQKCSDLQIELTSYKTKAELYDELKHQVEYQISQLVHRDDVIADIRTQLHKSLERVQVLEEEQRWRDVEFRNDLATKDAKIEELRKNLNVNSEIVRLQNEVKRLYERNQIAAREKMEQVSTLARKETLEELNQKQSERIKPNARQATKHRLNELDEFDEISPSHSTHSTSMDSQGFASLSQQPDRKSSVESRSKVFRHKLQKIYSLDLRDLSVETPNVTERPGIDGGHDQQPLFLYSFENPPASLPRVLGFQRRSQSSMNEAAAAMSSMASRFPPIYNNNNNKIVPTDLESKEDMFQLSLSSSLTSVGSGTGGGIGGALSILQKSPDSA